jgi:hypothetical protein
VLHQHILRGDGMVVSPLLGRHLLSSRHVADIALRLKYLATTYNALMGCATAGAERTALQASGRCCYNSAATKASMKSTNTPKAAWTYCVLGDVASCNHRSVSCVVEIVSLATLRLDSAQLQTSQ